MIAVENLSKRFDKLQAVDDISFEVREGEIYGLLGPNGAGKTTTLSMIAGLLVPDDGRVLFEGMDIALDPLGVRQRLGVVPQEVALYEELTARENLRFWGGLYGLSGKALDAAADRVLGQVDLTARAGDKVQKYSGGMKRRLNLALGIIHEPRIVMMDEPTVGIDPQARARILDVVRDIARSGKTVLYTTHYLEEAEEHCDRVGIMDHGKLLAEGTVDELKALHGGGDLVTIRGRFDEQAAIASLDGLDVKPISAADGRLMLATKGNGAGSVKLLSALDGKLDVEGVSIQTPSLNSLFLRLTGRELRD